MKVNEIISRVKGMLWLLWHVICRVIGNGQKPNNNKIKEKNIEFYY
jgi:hypothetical protein